jgi:hypothetical protein
MSDLCSRRTGTSKRYELWGVWILSVCVLVTHITPLIYGHSSEFWKRGVV